MVATKRIGLIGFGAIGMAFVKQWRARPVAGYSLVGVCMRPAQVPQSGGHLPAETLICHDIDELLALQPDSIIEAAGHRVIEASGASIVRAGCSLYLLSVGSLAHAEVRQSLVEAAERGGGQILIPAGALAGFDGLRALARDGLASVKYTSTKPPAAWQGTPAAQNHSLETITARTVIFRGNAARAAIEYPRNANLAAAVALAGIGLERTEIELVADPSTSNNIGTVEAVSASTRMTLTVSSRPSNNPKTSAIVSASVLSALENNRDAIRFV